MISYILEFIDGVKTQGLEKIFHRYYSIYRGRVVDNLDPEKRGRVKVVVPNLFGDAPAGDKITNVLPWAQPRDFRGSRNGSGEFFPPEVDDWVYVEFEMGDAAFPVYSGGWYGKDEDSKESEIAPEFLFGPDNTPLVRGYKDKFGFGWYFDQTKDKEKLVLTTPSGHFLILDDTKSSESIFIKHKSGAQFQINKAGSINVFAKNGSYLSMNAEKDEFTIANKTGALIGLKEDITISDSSGKSVINVSADSVQVTSSKDVVVSGNAITASAGAITISDSIGKLKMGNGKIALGTPAIEIFDALIQAIDAILNDPAPYITGVGPTSGLLGASKVQLTVLKGLISSVKTSV